VRTRARSCRRTSSRRGRTWIRCRYAARPPLALERLQRSPDGHLVYRMKRTRAGVLDLVLTPEELVKKLATLVPPPRAQGMRYHGVYAPNSKARRRVVPAEPEPARVPVTESSPQTEPLESRKTQRIPWAELLKKVFSLDVLACPRCQGRMAVIAFISQATVARRILDHLGLDSQAPTVARARAPPELFDPGPDCSVDPVYPDP
jgi:hypothetical protein